jgi:hypothetical protein
MHPHMRMETEIQRNTEVRASGLFRASDFVIGHFLAGRSLGEEKLLEQAACFRESK